jgi:tetratricopeptide (TPR) repeat protein
LLGLVLVGAVVLSYQPAWNAGYIWDDDAYVTNNPLLTAPDGMQRIWFSTDSPSQYFPLAYTTFRLEHALWGFNPAGYHWVNILLHAANALLVWRLLKRLSVPGSLLGAAIFALHPVQVESVAWVTELKNVQSLFFYLLALLAWVRFAVETRAETVKSRILWYGLALVCYALALFSKSTACTLPLALLLVLWLKEQPITWRRVAQVVPFGAMGLAIGLVSIWWERHHQGTGGQGLDLGFLERVLIASRAAWFYLGKLLWPADLAFNYPLWKVDATDALAYVWLAAGVALCAVILFARRYAGRSIETAALFFVGTLSPLLGFVMLYTFRYTFVADHYQYVAMIGPAALAGAGLSWLGRLVSGNQDGESKMLPTARVSGQECARPRAQRSSNGQARWSTLWNQYLSAALLMALVCLSWRQSRTYHDLETLWRVALARNPRSFMAHNNLGAIFLAREQVAAAMGCFERALEICPNHANAHGNLGHALLRQGRVAAAVGEFERAFELEPCAKGHSDLGYGLLQAGRLDEAIAHCRQAVALRPWEPEPRNILGLALAQSGRMDEAIASFEAAATLRADYIDAHGNLAMALLQMGRPAEAVPHFRKVLEAQPGNADAHNNTGWALLQAGQCDEAIACFQSALRLAPDIAIAHNNLALALLRKGRPREALAQYRAYLKCNPDDAHVLAEVAWVLAASPDEGIRDGMEAVSLAQRAEQLSGGRDAAILRALAAAYAESGQFAEAVGAARRGLELKPEAALADGLRSQLRLFEAGSPCRDGAVALANNSNRL